jgi:hypothetical protein
MKRKAKQLEIDFIGGQGPLTIEEERTISEYLSTRKPLKPRRVRAGAGTRSRKAALV